jgi:hypothetical protein
MWRGGGLQTWTQEYQCEIKDGCSLITWRPTWKEVSWNLKTRRPTWKGGWQQLETKKTNTKKKMVAVWKHENQQKEEDNHDLKTCKPMKKDFLHLENSKTTHKTQQLQLATWEHPHQHADEEGQL